MVKIAPSILSVSQDRIKSEVESLENAGADYIHVDVMDGEFVMNKTDGLSMIENVHEGTKLPIDTHLMVENPESFLEDFMRYSNIITFHIEAVAEEEIRNLIDTIHENEVNVGIAIKPNTPVEEVFPYLDSIELVLIMLVEPGFGGQTLIQECLEKVRVLREIRPDLEIEVDGGVNLSNVELVKESGASLIVSGTAILKESDREYVISKMKS